MKRKSPSPARFVTWDSITERDWTPHLRRNRLARGLKLRRVRPGTPEYEQVLALRHSGFVESGFIASDENSVESMRLPRDGDSIILALFSNKTVRATVTLNTITPRFPGMAMELEKGVVINHPSFHSREVLEITKLVVDPGTRGTRAALALFSVAMLVARLLGKSHLWQVSRDVPQDISWRAALGFDYSLNCHFVDRSLNNMPSCVGYLYLPDAAASGRIPSFIRSIYREVLSLEPIDQASNSMERPA